MANKRKVTAQVRRDFDLEAAATRRWFTSRTAARKRGLRGGGSFVVLECVDEDCTEAPYL